MWEDYKKLTHKGKKSFFATTEAPEAVKLQSFVQLETSFKAQIAAKQKCSVVIDGDIVSKIIVDLLLLPQARIEQQGGNRGKVHDDPEVSYASPLSIELSDGEEDDDRGAELPSTYPYAHWKRKGS
jgi:hypothetical protein